MCLRKLPCYTPLQRHRKRKVLNGSMHTYVRSIYHQLQCDGTRSKQAKWDVPSATGER